MQYRPYRNEDFAALYAVEELCFEPSDRFPRSYMRRVIESPDAATWIADENGRVAGFAVVEWKAEFGEIFAYIQTIEVAPGFRGRGVGGGLLRCVESSAQAAGAAHIWLHVDENNEPAIHLYRVQGYRRRGRQPNYYARNRAAEIYVKPIASHAPVE